MNARQSLGGTCHPCRHATHTQRQTPTVDQSIEGRSIGRCVAYTIEVLADPLYVPENVTAYAIAVTTSVGMNHIQSGRR